MVLLRHIPEDREGDWPHVPGEHPRADELIE
jgi:hypothetical protein